jgi:hypothetical protein
MSDEQKEQPAPEPEIPQQIDITVPRPTDKLELNSLDQRHTKETDHE